MARIPEDDVERIKREVSLAELVRGAGVDLAQHGASGDLAGRCPFHDEDDTPSLIMTEREGQWHCAVCGAGGDQIAWVMRREGVSFREAAERLATGDGAALTGAALAAKVQGAAEDDAALALAIVEIYHARATIRPDVATYLHARGIERAREMIRRFRLGLADRALGYGLPARLRDRLRTLGFIRASGHEHFAGSVVAPIFDSTGGVGEVYGRKLLTNLRKGTPLHLYRVLAASGG